VDVVMEAIHFLVSEVSQVSEARRGASALAARAGFDEEGAGRVALVVTEAATNLVKHGRGGQIILRAFDDGERGVEVLVLDRGGGMASVAECQRDGFSTSGSSGTGLGAIARLSDHHEIYSQPDRGTALIARLFSARREPGTKAPSLEVGGFSIPKRGEEVCGDDWALRPRALGGTVTVVDGLGHGIEAAAAAREAITVLHDRPARGPAATIQDMHGALRHTRGAAAAVCDVDLERELVTYAGVGNVSGIILSGRGNRSMVSHNGIVGHQMRVVQEFSFPWPDDALLVLHSDGLTSHWSLDGYPGLLQRHPSLIAGVLYRDFERGRDDVTVVVGRRAAA
jgi:anti-sigma regulatory factor (Ser/Thr protein kinase)